MSKSCVELDDVPHGAAQQRFAADAGLAFARPAQLKPGTLGRLVASNHNFVCFDCRVAVRRPKTTATQPTCPKCGHVCLDIGYKIAVPPKEDAHAWTRLDVTLRENERRNVIAGQKARVARIHRLERQIERLSLLPTDAGRDRTIRELTKRLRETQRRPG